MEFLNKLLPATGLYCVARATVKDENGQIVRFKNKAGKEGFIHRWFSSRPEVRAHLHTMDEEGHTVYLAQASFDVSATGRLQTNVCRVRSFWLDIDCGEKKFQKNPRTAYVSQVEAAQDLKRFIEESNLPFPAVVNSGNGLYAYWFLQEELNADSWKELAKVLKHICVAYGFRADPMRTADSASVLRFPGTTNRKNGVSKDVLIIRDSAPLDFKTFTAALQAAAKRKQVNAQTLATPKNPGLNSEFMAGLEGPPSDPHKIADKCAQIHLIRDTLGDVDEPLWYAAIGLLRHCEDGEAVIQGWSSGHPDYTEEATAAKIAQHKFPPTTCEGFGAVNPHGCIGCMYNSKIKTPLTLGYPAPKALTAQEGGPVPDLPKGFSRTEDGLWDLGENVRFYPYDLFVTQVCYDESTQCETMTIRHKLPHDGWKEFSVRSALLHDAKQLMMTMTDNHVHVAGNQEKKSMVGYLERYKAGLVNNRKVARLFCQMGWKDVDGEFCFVLGNKLYHPSGEVTEVGLARNVPEVIKAFKSTGTAEDWTATTEVLKAPGMEAFAFVLLAGAFGAPLMRFTGFPGALVSMVGDSGVGKTLMGDWLLSAWGDPAKLTMAKEDTHNALVGRLGIYGSLPLYIDEVSNIDPMDLSNLAYRFTQGRDKVRLTKNAVERENINSWSTIGIVSSNHQLLDKLGSIKADASAEMNRVFEFLVHAHPLFGKIINNVSISTAVRRKFMANFGTIGEKYVQYLVTHSEEHEGRIDQIKGLIDARTSARPEERFWSAIAATAIYGGVIAQKLGLIKFALPPVMDWVVNTITGMRAAKGAQTVDSVDLLGRFIDQHMQNILILNRAPKNQFEPPIQSPRGPLVIRLELDSKRLFISRDVLKKYLYDNYGSYTKMRRDLEMTVPVQALLRSDLRKVLGAGTHLSGVQQPVWEIDLTAPALGHVALSLVRQAESVANINGLGVIR